MFEERLIQEIQKRKWIYDTSHAQYKDRLAKQNAWDEISKKLNKSVEKCQHRWKSLRDRYVKEYRMRQATGNSSAVSDEERPAWRWLPMLSFLDEVIESKASYSFRRKINKSIDEEFGFSVIYNGNNNNSSNNNNITNGFTKEEINEEDTNDEKEFDIYNNDNDNDNDNDIDNENEFTDCDNFTVLKNENNSITFSVEPVHPINKFKNVSSSKKRKLNEYSDTTIDIEPMPIMAANEKRNEDSDDEGFCRMIGTMIKKVDKEDRDQIRVETINYVFEKVNYIKRERQTAQLLREDSLELPIVI